jgi:hypothetical protein
MVKKQIDGLRKACRFTPSENQDENDPSCMLPEDARMRIKKVLRNLPKS